MICITTLLAAVLTTPTQAAPLDDEAVALESAALELEFRLGRKNVTGHKVQAKLSPAVRHALNHWAPLAREFDFRVTVCEQADALLLGKCDKDDLNEAAGWVDEAWELFANITPTQDDHEPRAVVTFLFDREGFETPAWDGLVDTFVAERMVDAATSDNIRADPGPLTLRHALAFVQPTYDMAGDAAAGDDEFRLGNEVVHKFTQALMRSRFGQSPESLRWGLGYVAEQRLFRSIYQFNASGFVSSDSHSRWPDRTRDTLQDKKGDKSFALSDQAHDDMSAGQALPSQMMTWAALDYLNTQNPDNLVALLDELGTLHADEDPRDRARSYAGDDSLTRDALKGTLDAIDVKTLRKHLKRVK